MNPIRTMVFVLLLGVGGCALRCSKETPPATMPDAVSYPTPFAEGRPARGAGVPAGMRDRPIPPGAGEHVDLRTEMVRSQLADPTDGRTPIRDGRVLRAMWLVPRHVFAVPNPPRLAYADTALPIGWDQTISQPYIVALMTELLRPRTDAKVLEIGTGSGYQAAVLAHLTPHVYTIEIVEPLGRRAMETLHRQGYHEVRCRIGDGYLGWPEAAPFDGILVTCAAESLPPPLWEQLKPGGRIVIPVGPADFVQRLVVVHKTPDGKRRDETVIPVQFVPLTRRGAPAGTGPTTSPPP